MKTPGQPPSPLGGSSPFGGNQMNWQQLLSQFLQQSQPTTNPDGTPGAPLSSQQPMQQPQQATNGMGGPQQQWFVPPTANGIWAKPGMTTPGIWGAGPAGSGGAGPGVA